MPRVLEGVITSVCEDGTINISPMGAVVELEERQMMLRPYQGSTTFANLRRTRHGIFHVTDDVLLIARAAVGQIDVQPDLLALPGQMGCALKDACRWYAVAVDTFCEQSTPAHLQCRVLESRRQRDFFGFNRAKHAVLEVAILATRIERLPGADILTEMERLTAVVEKTGGQKESEAFSFLAKYIRDRCEV